MLVALETYLKEDHAATWKEWEGRCHRITEALKEFKDVRTEIRVPPIANAVPHLHIRWDAQAHRVTPAEMVKKLREGEPSIEVSPGSRNPLVIGVWMMQPGDDAIVGRRIREILAGA